MANATTSFPPGYLEQSRQVDICTASAITLFAATVAVGARFWARRYMNIGWRTDDWLIFVALVSAYGLSIDFWWWTTKGFGKHMVAAGPAIGYFFPLGLFIAEMFYTGVVVFVKYSILALYWRLFRTTNIKIPLLVFGFVVTAWGLAVFLLSILSCVPTVGQWDKSVHSSCNVNQQEFLFGISIPNILTDVALLILPVPYIVRLNMNASQKRILCSLFLLGGFVCIASILRLVSVVQESSDPDVTWSFVNQIIWASVETNFAIIGACLPCLRPVWLRIRGQTPQRKTQLYASHMSRTVGGTPAHNSKHSRHAFNPITGGSVAGTDRGSSSMEDPYASVDYPEKPRQARHPMSELPALPSSPGSAPERAHIEVIRNWTVEYKKKDASHEALR